MNKESIKRFIINFIFVSVILLPIKILFLDKMEQPRSNIISIFLAAFLIRIGNKLYDKHIKKIQQIPKPFAFSRWFFHDVIHHNYTLI